MKNPLGSLMKQAQQMQDKMQRELAELEIETSVGGGADSLKSFSDHRKCVLGRKHQHRSGAQHREAAQAGSARCDTDRHVQGQKALAALGLSAENADGLIGPKPFDKPFGLIGRIGEIACAFYG